MVAVTATAPGDPPVAWANAMSRMAEFPRLRYMGSKYRLVPHLAEVFGEVRGVTALDAFSGSGVVSYLLKTLGCQVTANDFLTFPAAITRATVVNQDETLTGEDIEAICGPPADDRDFIQRTFDGLFFTADDRRFLDSAWSHIDQMTGREAGAGHLGAGPIGGAQAAARRLHRHRPAVRRRPPRPAAAAAGTFPGTGSGVQPRRFRQRPALQGRHRRYLRPRGAAVRPGSISTRRMRRRGTTTATSSGTTSWRA